MTSPWEGRDELGAVVAHRYEPDGRDASCSTVRPLESTTDLVLLAVLTSLARPSFAALGQEQDVIAELGPVFCGIAQGEEDHSFEAADRVALGEKVLADLGRFDHRVFNAWEHGGECRVEAALRRLTFELTPTAEAGSVRLG
jgi:hypothetical protein